MRAIPAHVYRTAAARHELARHRLIRNAGAAGGRVLVRIENEAHADAAPGSRQQRLGYAVVGQMEHRHIDRVAPPRDRKSTRLNSSHLGISYAVFCLKKKKTRVTCVAT